MLIFFVFFAFQSNNCEARVCVDIYQRRCIGDWQGRMSLSSFVDVDGIMDVDI